MSKVPKNSSKICALITQEKSAEAATHNNDTNIANCDDES